MKPTKLLTLIFILFVVAQTFGFLYLHIFYTPAKAIWENPTTNMQVPFPELEFGEAKACLPPDEDKMCVPWIGDYITGIYKYAVGIVGILATVVMMIGGVMWITAVGNASRLSEAKAWIGAALTGLILAMTSYTILYQVNPKLTQFKGLPVAIPKSLEQEQGTNASTVNSLRAAFVDYAGTINSPNLANLINTAKAAETSSGATDDLTAQFFKLERQFEKEQKLKEAAAAAEQAAKQARSAQNAFKALENEFLKQQKKIIDAKKAADAAKLAAEKAKDILAYQILLDEWNLAEIKDAQNQAEEARIKSAAAKKAAAQAAYELEKEAHKITLASREVQEPISFTEPQKIEVDYILVVQSRAIKNAPIKTYKIAGGYVESTQEALDTLAKLKKDPATLKVFKIIEAACKFPSLNVKRR